MLRANGDLVVYIGTEGSDEVWREVVKGLDVGNVSEEVLVHKLFLWTPDLFSTFMKDCIKVRVLLSCLKTRWRSKEIGEEVNIDVVGFVKSGGRRLYGGGSDRGQWVAKRWGWALNNIFGRWRVGGWCCNDGQWDVLNFFDEGKVSDDHVEIGSVGSDIGEEVQQLILYFLEDVSWLFGKWYIL